MNLNSHKLYMVNIEGVCWLAQVFHMRRNFKNSNLGGFPRKKILCEVMKAEPFSAFHYSTSCFVCISMSATNMNIIAFNLSRMCISHYSDCNANCSFLA